MSKRRPPRNNEIAQLRAAVATQTVQIAELTRRLTPAQMAAGTPLPPHMTGEYDRKQREALAQAEQQAKHYKAPAGSSMAPGKMPKGMGDEQGPGVPSNAAMQQMQTNQGPDAEQITMFSPGAPLMPVTGIESQFGPRQKDFQIAVNTVALPRSDQITTFDQLRNLADLYEGIMLCKRVWYDVLNRLELKVTFAEGIIPDGQSESDDKWQAITQPAADFLAYPDGENTLADWMIQSVDDILTLGQSIIYLARDRKGEIIRLDTIDAALIKPLYDHRGRLPDFPFYGFEQYIKGVPAGLYYAEPARVSNKMVASSMVIMREMARSDTIYGRSRVEDILIRVNQALRKTNLDTNRFTDGAIPDGMLFLTADGQGMTADEVEEHERRLNGLLAGNDRLKVRLKIAPPGIQSFTSTRPEDPHTDYDKMLLNYSVGAFGITMDELGFTDNSNKSVGETQQAVTYRRVVAPLAKRYADFLTRIIRQKFDDRLRVQWGGVAEIADMKAKADLLAIGVERGAISPTFMAHEMGWKVDKEVPAFVIAQGGPAGIVVMDDIEDVRQQNMQANDLKIQASKASLDITQKQSTMLGNQIQQQQEQAAEAKKQAAEEASWETPGAGGTPPGGEEGATAAGGSTPPEDSGGSGAAAAAGNSPPASDETAEAGSGNAAGEADQAIATAKSKATRFDEPVVMALEDADEIRKGCQNPIHGDHGHFAGCADPGAGNKAVIKSDISKIGGMSHEIALQMHQQGRQAAAEGSLKAAQAFATKEQQLKQAATTGARSITRQQFNTLTDHRVRINNEISRLASVAAKHPEGSTPYTKAHAQLTQRVTERNLIDAQLHRYMARADEPDGVRTDAAMAATHETIASPADITAEWRRYRTVALRAVKANEPVPVFTSDVLPSDEHQLVATQLAAVSTPDGVRGVFAAARLRQEAPPEPTAERAAPAILPAPTADDATGVMVALMLPLAAAEQIAVPGGLPPSDLHITLCYVGDLADGPIDRDRLMATVQQWAASQHPLYVDLDRLDRFPGDGEKAPIIVRSDTAVLQDVHSSLCAALDAAGIDYPNTYPDYKPHCTLCYVPADAPTPNLPTPDLHLCFTVCTVAYGEERVLFPLGCQRARWNCARRCWANCESCGRRCWKRWTTSN